MQKVFFEDLGVKDYKEAWDYQEELLAKTVAVKTENRKNPEANPKATENYLLFCQHPHVYTLGKSGDENNMLLNQAQLMAKDASFYKINRGGDITYHGPGQLVGYPIIDLENFFTDIHKYMRFLEEAIILTLKEYGIESGRVEGSTGVWLDIDTPNVRKICAMGVKCSRWVTMHGFAFNINANLQYFNNIVPCGIVDKGVTSLNKELGVETVDFNEVQEKVLINMANLFDFEVERRTAIIQ